MVEKKTTHKETAKKTKDVAKKLKTEARDAAEKVGEVANKVKDEATVIGKEVGKKGKVLWGGFSSWWNASTPAERVSMILGILVLIWGLRLLRNFVGGIVLILLGVMGITGFFIKKE